MMVVTLSFIEMLVSVVLGLKMKIYNATDKNQGSFQCFTGSKIRVVCIYGLSPEATIFQGKNWLQKEFYHEPEKKTNILDDTSRSAGGEN